eukprot:1150442-Pelagomonas_calceolata.AAC.5
MGLCNSVGSSASWNGPHVDRKSLERTPPGPGPSNGIHITMLMKFVMAVAVPGAQGGWAGKGGGCSRWARAAGVNFTRSRKIWGLMPHEWGFVGKSGVCQLQKIVNNTLDELIAKSKKLAVAETTEL